MNCTAAEKLIHAERDDRLDDVGRRALHQHLEDCDDCRALRATLAAGVNSWRETAATTPAPDASSEWLKIRRAIRNASGATVHFGTVERLPWWRPVLGGAGAVAALALVFALWPRSRESDAAFAANDLARVEFVEFAEEAGPPVVFVDEDSGFVIVWAEMDAEPIGS